MVSVTQWTSFVFLAHSLGAYVATVVTTLYPELVEGLIMLDFMFPTDPGQRLHAWWSSDANIHAKSELLTKSPPVYSKEEMVRKIISSRGTGLAKDEPVEDK